MLVELQGGTCRFEKGSDFREVQLLLHFPARDVRERAQFGAHSTVFVHCMLAGDLWLSL